MDQIHRCNYWQLLDGQVNGCPEVLQELQRNGRPAIETLSPGWSAMSIWYVENRLYILLLKNEEGKRALWFFDVNGNFIGNSVKSIMTISPWMREAFVALFNRIIFECFDPMRYQAHLISELIEPLSLELSVLFDEFFDSAKDLTGDLQSPEGRVLNLHPSKFQDEVLKLDRGEINLNWHGRQLRATRGIVINDFIFAYPLFEHESLSAIFFVGSHVGLSIACFDMVGMKLFYRIADGSDSRLLMNLIDHLSLYWKSLRDYFGGVECMPIAGVTRSNHIGHRLWNEITGLYRIRQNGNAKNLSAILHSDPHDSGEIWIGAREVLDSPELEVIYHQDFKNIVKWIYQNRVFPLRIGDSYISKNLVNLVATHCRSNSRILIPKKMPEELRIVFGLRFENRTWVNQTDGLAELAIHLAKNIPKLTIIVDGHDRILERKALSHGEQLGSLDILRLEKNVVMALEATIRKQGFANRVTIVDAVDIELSDTMALILSADCFVAPWGAGLAKYKWIANLDGVIFSSQQVIQTNSDLRIYENKKIREDALECIYLPVRYIADLSFDSHMPEIKLGSEKRENFIVDVAGLKATVDQLLVRVQGSGK